MRRYTELRHDHFDHVNARNKVARKQSGGHNRAFTRAQEAELVAKVLATPGANKASVRKAALDLQTKINDSEQGRTRSQQHDMHFTFGDKFIDDFKKRNGLTSQRVKVRRAPIRNYVPPSPTQIDQQLYNFVFEVRDRIMQYGASVVMNLDETPIRPIEPPRTAITRTHANGHQLVLRAQGCDCIITSVPVITASGGKLPMFIILKGTTEVCVRKLTKGITHTSHPLKQLITYHNTTGFMNDDILCSYIETTIGPYVRRRFEERANGVCWPPDGPCAALILDAHRSHHTIHVQRAAERAHIEIISIPSFPSSTSMLQPLDVGVNGVLKQMRQKVFMKSIQALNDTTDRVITIQETVLSQINAYKSLSPNVIRNAFRKAGLIN